MTQTNHPSRGGWRQEEIDLLFQSVQQASEGEKALRDVFAEVGQKLSRRPNSIRNFYYARVREHPELASHKTSFRTFTEEEVRALIREVLMGRGGGESVRACVTRLAGGDRAGMLRYQNKYRSVLKNRPELLMEVADELRLQGLPCPENAAACRRYERTARAEEVTRRLEKHMADPAVRAMAENLLSLLERKNVPGGTPETVPYHKWAEARSEADRLKVEADLLRMALEDERKAKESAQS